MIQGAILNCWADVSVMGSTTNIIIGRIGGLVGDLESNSASRPASVKNSFALGNVTGYGPLGGLIGYVKNVSSTVNISNSYATGNVIGNGTSVIDHIGGLIGHVDGDAPTSISYVHAIGDVGAADTNTNRISSAGGLIGTLGSNSVLSFAYADGNVSVNDTAQGAYHGGLVGLGNGKISNSYASGNVKGQNAVGGLVGMLQDGGSITSSYAKGQASGTTLLNVGGLVGGLATNNTTISGSYFNSDLNSSGVGSSSYDPDGAHKLGDLTTAELNDAGISKAILSGDNVGDAVYAFNNPPVVPPTDPQNHGDDNTAQAVAEAAAQAAVQQQTASTVASIGSNQVAAASQEAATISGGVGSINLASLDLTSINLANAFTVSADLGGNSGASNAGLTSPENPFTANLGQVSVDGQGFTTASGASSTVCGNLDEECE
jgi:hypothetical protein